MIEQQTAEWVASFLGLLGSLALAVPFFADFFAKRRRVKRLAGLKDGVFSPEDAAELRKPVERRELENVLAAEVKMAGLAALGCVFLVASFFVLLLAKQTA